jgi:hypothetical protein
MAEEKPPYHVLAEQHNALIAAGKHDEAAEFHRDNIANYHGKPAVAKKAALEKTAVAPSDS